MNEVGRFSVVAALLGSVVTTVYIGGLAERRERTILRMASLVVLGAYLAGPYSFLSPSVKGLPSWRVK